MTVSRLIFAGALALATCGADGAVFINEIHYDDSTAAGDLGEAIEVVATNGEDLSAYDLVLYNGSGGATYDTDPLPVGSSASCGGSVSAGVVNYATNGVQNGPPDGVALVLRASSTVVQFLSYEGSFAATNGPAMGMTSTDIIVFETNSTAPGTSLQLGGGPGSTYAEFTWNDSASATFGGCNNGQTFAGGVDIPPTVASTTPANNAVNVAPIANITIQFSEAVTTNPGWIAFNCTASGNVAAVESGTGSSRTLDLVPTLAFGETCAGTVVAANVIDQDGTPDLMTANYQFSFTVVPDNPPTVASTVPANNASNVPMSSNISISFSEPVSVSGSWYSINCANSGAHPAVVSGGPQNYTLNPDTNFDLLELCTVTLTGALIVDQDGNPDPLASNFVWTFTSAASAANYYNSVDSSSAAALRSSLHSLIDDHTAYRYSIGTNNCNLSAPSTVECDVWDIVEAAEQDPGDPNMVLDVYRNRKYTKITQRSGATGPNNYNREHTWPNSLGFNNLGGVDANNNPYSPYVDGHMLYASASDHNGSRGSRPYDNCSQTATCGGTENVTDANYGFGGGSGTYPGNSNWALGGDGMAGSYEVWNHRKGDMARAILYMDIRYEGGTHANTQPEPDLIVTNNRSLIIGTDPGVVPAFGYMGILDTLLAWHQADPPDAGEILRNEIVYGFQGNRNPFIDHPEYAACLWQNACTAGENIFGNGFE